MLAGKDDALSRRLKLAGFPVRNIDPETVFSKYHVAAAPWLILVSPAGDVQYQGGYTPAHARNNYQDQQVWADLANGRPVEPLPVLGCALGKRVQRSIDPLGIKYSN